MNRITLGESIRRARLDAGLTQSELATELAQTSTPFYHTQYDQGYGPAAI